ncbi:MAG: protein translocase subunit SecDF [Alphaproteobacteria bacterium]|nr:protein translocase subunit SecDF [Alphaproteobacteria bacterium]
MQLKGFVRFFAIALILICVYQLSFTFFVKNFESSIEKKANSWIKKFPSPEKKYPNNKLLQEDYQDSLDNLKSNYYARLIDSLKGSKIAFGLVTYKEAKEKEILLGLDLQGGMSVTMEVGLDGLIKALANYTKDKAFNDALNKAVQQKAVTNTNLIDLFYSNYTQANPNSNLASFFAYKSNNEITNSSSNTDVLNYLNKKSADAFKNTYQILQTRIDRFGLASPTINPDPLKGRINIELAGITDKERVRNYLQSTANLQFFEMYTLENVDIQNDLVAADKTVQAYLNGIGLDTLNVIDTAGIADSTKNKLNANPIFKILNVAQPYTNPKTKKTIFPSEIGYVLARDTAILNQYLNYSFVKNKFPNNLRFCYGKLQEGSDKNKTLFTSLYAIKVLDNGQAPLEGDHVANSAQDYDERGKIAIKMNMDNTGTTIWARLTTANREKPIAIVLDNIVYSAPTVNEPITTGNSQITGNFTVKEAQDLAQILQSGKLPAPAKIVQEQQVGPTLGKAAIKGGALSFIISFVVIFVLMLLYFNTGGWVANIALILNLLFTIGILSSLGFTLTAPGIAGLVLTIGMAVDTNVIIFERIKEELIRGKSYALAINDGYKRSLSPVLDAHVTTLLTAFILAYFGLGPVLGFATTQIIGIILSLFCGILVSRLITDIYTNKNRHFEYFTKLSKTVFQHKKFKFIEYRKYAYFISAIVLVLGVASFFNGFDEGVEFSGGRSYTIKFPKTIDQEVLRDELKVVFEDAPIIKTVDTKNQLNITTAFMISNTTTNADSVVENVLYNAVLKYLPENTSFADFNTNYIQSSQKVTASISEDLKSGAQKATIIALIVICFYIFIRFRDWRYSLGTIFSLLHDVFVTLIVFSFFRKIVNFPLEIDQHFIAAILTVIGFSMNDTVIVYDRIREDSKILKGKTNAFIINQAINETLSRTIMTSLTVFLTILILFIFGGEVTKGFAFAMLIGVFTGTYSSIFVAAPVLVDFAKNKPLGKTES